ncbi:6-pyruvoyltetrahydropterin/6-carboxytetrahydropterin synthase [Paenibacillus sp. 1_12]|uniref:6-carboxytetrahydropterin synthase n=1 Tax=Paenibacillus sp. 1_12 TaxID=1566278 RepID=UPI0008E38550|nr:6-carboxytetrahydropterin synthase [Paenibacillus sp. 1_12]SFL58842.1 6-pyruvoyltetrahydropterin/6-carboxytetrahydropterin synthase [Paenibacillus sp. 1_12]
MSLAYITRKIHFSAAHSYRVSNWSEDENIQVFGLCSNSNGHGHDYELELTIRGEIDEKSGIVINVVEIDKVIKQVIDEIDGKFLNKEHPYFIEHIPTTENLTTYLWNRIDGSFTNVELFRIRVLENHYLQSEKGRGPLVYLTRQYHFCSAHRLHSDHLSEEENKELFGKCNNPHGHGHNYYLDVSVGGEPDPITGMIMNLAELDQIVNTVIINKYDHKHLNLDTEDYKEMNPTGEVMAMVICNLLKSNIPKLHRIGLWETKKNYFEYFA